MAHLVEHVYLENTSGSHNKFYEMSIFREEPNVIIISYGRIEKYPGVTRREVFISIYQAVFNYEKLIANKIAKGYQRGHPPEPNTNITVFKHNKVQKTTKTEPKKLHIDDSPEINIAI